MKIQRWYTLTWLVIAVVCLLLTSCASTGYDPMKRRATEFTNQGNKALTNIIETSNDHSEVLAAKILLKQTSWESAFTQYEEGQLDLGTVLGAVALVTSPEPKIDSVVEACHSYIRKGDVSKIPELISLLVRFGDKELAEDYMNCGQSDLYAAGVEWAQNHGYNVQSGYDGGSARVRWGQNR